MIEGRFFRLPLVILSAVSHSPTSAENRLVHGGGEGHRGKVFHTAYGQPVHSEPFPTLSREHVGTWRVSG